MSEPLREEGDARQQATWPRKYALDNVDWSDPCSYVREMYGVPANPGGRIVLNGMPGVIEGGDGARLRVRIDSHPEWGAISAHPTWRMEYLDV